MNDLLTFLRAQLEIDEAEADAILSPPPGHYDKGWQADKLREFAMRQLAEVETKRLVLDEAHGYTPELEHGDNGEWAFETVIKLLAQPYAGRPGWRKEWSAEPNRA